MKNDLTKTLKNESKDRKKMMEEVTNNLDTYSFRIIELEEIKYKNLERESKELTKIYELKLEDLNNKTTSLENELKQTRMELVNEKTISKNLKSFLEVIVNHYGLDEMEQLSGISIDKIKEYLH